MGLLQSLGLPTPAAAPPLPALDVAADEEAPARADGPRSAAKAKGGGSAPSLEEMAQWPSKAHRAWKRLDHARQAAVVVQMASRYGDTFAKDFVAAAKSGKTKLEGADFVTALDSQTPDAMKARGFKLAQHASNGDRAQEWWVRADGFEVFLLRVLGQDRKTPSTTGPGVAPPTRTPPKKPPVEPPVEPPGTCSKESLEQIEMALQWAQAALAEARQAQKEIEAEKARMDKLNVTSKDFAKAYEAMTERLKDDIAHLEGVIGDVTTTKEALEKSGCDLTKLDTALDDLGHELTAAEVEKSLHEMDIRKPIDVDVKDVPDDEE